MEEKLLLVLSKQNIMLSKYEALFLLKPKHYKLYNNVLALTLKNTSRNTKLIPFLAYTKSAFAVLFTSKSFQGLLKKTAAFDFSKYYNKSLGVFKIGKGISIKQIADEVFTKMNKHKNAKVSLTSPEISFYIIKTEKLFFFAKLIHKNKENFNARSAHKRPGFSPISLSPKLARAMVNLSGKINAKVLDPLCGTAGILIEAGLLGHRVIGNDISRKMLSFASHNLDFFGIKNYKLISKDALTLNIKADAIITDMPYGKNTKSIPETLYTNFLHHSQNITDTMVVVFPKKIKITKGMKWKKKAVIPYYIHKSMTKYIYVLTKTH